MACLLVRDRFSWASRPSPTSMTPSVPPPAVSPPPDPKPTAPPISGPSPLTILVDPRDCGFLHSTLLGLLGPPDETLSVSNTPQSYLCFLPLQQMDPLKTLCALAPPGPTSVPTNALCWSSAPIPLRRVRQCICTLPRPVCTHTTTLSRQNVHSRRSPGKTSICYKSELIKTLSFTSLLPRFLYTSILTGSDHRPRECHQTRALSEWLSGAEPARPDARRTSCAARSACPTPCTGDTQYAWVPLFYT
jgi:hypothetical protein